MVLLIKRLLLLACIVLPLQGCTSLLFQPMQVQVRTPADVGIDYRDLYFHAADGTLLHGWFLPARGEAKGTILFLHGNAENISTHLGSVWWLPAEGYNVFLYDYRGYGYSEGKPSLDGLMSDFEGALGKARTLPEIEGKPIVVFGQSLGGAVSISAVARSPQREAITGVIVEGAFSDYHRIAREKLADFWLTWPLQWPLSLTIHNGYSPLDDVAKLSPLPVLIIRDGSDAIIPGHHATDLFNAAAEPKRYWVAEGAPHIGAFASPAMRQRLVEYLDTLTRPIHP